METPVVIEDRHPRSTANIGLSGVSDILRRDGRLVATERLHSCADVERSRDVLQLNPVNLYPEVLDTSLDNQPGEISAGRQGERCTDTC